MKKPRNKRYVPKPVSLNPLSEVFGGMSGDHAEHLRVLNIRNHAAMSALARGTGGREEWDLLVGAINIANVMCEQGIGDEFRAATIAGRDALMAVGKRGAVSGRGIGALPVPGRRAGGDEQGARLPRRPA